METKELEVRGDAKAIISGVTTLAKKLDGFKVTSQDSYLEAGEYLKEIKDKIRRAEGLCDEYAEPFKKAKQKAEEGRKQVELFFAQPILRLKALKDFIEKRVTDWRNVQLEKERIAREKAEAEAREKERLEKERLREEAEAKEKEAEKARLAAEKASQNGRHATVQKNIEKAQEATTEAKDLKQEAREVEVETKEVKTKVGKIDGLGFRRYWRARIIDETKIPREFLKVDEVAINEYVTKNKEKAVIPGVEVFFEDKSVG